MSKISEYDLKAEARSRGYRPEILEKVFVLLDLLHQFMMEPFLRKRLVLKGGTALNLFHFEGLPRLSVDLDFNYIGSIKREEMQSEKIELEKIILSIAERMKFTLHRNPTAHAGGKMVFIYQSALGTKGRIEVDLNYMYRTSLWDTQYKTAIQGQFGAKDIPILDIHEVAAGKLHALLEREASRDLFDSHYLLTKLMLNQQKLRLAFTTYAGMNKSEWSNISLNNIKFSVNDIRDRLIPVLRQDQIPGTSSKDIHRWAEQLVSECKAAFGKLLPFNPGEAAFLQMIQEERVIKPELICQDPILNERIIEHPLLKWRALHPSKVKKTS